MNKEHKELLDDYYMFLSSGVHSKDQVKATTNSQADSKFSRLRERVESDLVRSPVQLALFYASLSVVGYLFSLSICAQNAVGFSSFSHRIAGYLHTLPDPLCPIICGSVFTGIPFVLACVFLNRFQHRYLIFRMWWFFASVPIVMTTLMLLLPHSMQHARLTSAISGSSVRPGTLSDSTWIAVWTTSAVLFPYFLELFVLLFVKPKKFRREKLEASMVSRVREAN